MGNYYLCSMTRDSGTKFLMGRWNDLYNIELKEDGKASRWNFDYHGKYFLDKISEKSDQESCATDEFEEKSSMSVDENMNTSNGVEETDEELMMGTWVKISENQEVKYSHKLGVPVVDNYGFLLGEFSILDDLRIYM
ncbi:hypothetical protein BC332_33932 [Capsicum chinense]|nr:hypothetical protein BC332_33932 [Capsicum chinense]